ncbi:MAG: hypothetical protein ACJ8LG_15855 [Massilia sp.]
MSTNTAAAVPTKELVPGISFDGRAYHYGQYSYDRLEDALNYAKLERARPGFHEAPTPQRWKQWEEPTLDERAQMAAHHISYEGGRYRYGPYCYDSLADALNYAQREPGLSLVAQPGTNEAHDR